MTASRWTQQIPVVRALKGLRSLSNGEDSLVELAVLTPREFIFKGSCAMTLKYTALRILHSFDTAAEKPEDRSIVCRKPQDNMSLAGANNNFRCNAQ